MLGGAPGSADFLPFRDDRTLETGELWTEQLFEALASAHAGVALLTKEALASSWVRQEVAYLNIEARGRRRPLYTFLVGKLSPADVKAAWPEIALADTQMEPFKSKAQAATLVARVKELVGPIAEQH